MITNTSTVINKEYLDLNPVLVGQEQCQPSHSFGPSVRTYWLLHFVMSGKGVFEIGGKRYQVEKGSFFVIPPHVETYYEADALDPWEYVWIGFQSASLPLHLDDVVHCPSAQRIFDDIRHCDRWHGGRTEMLCAKLFELFALLMEKAQGKEDYINHALSIIHAEYMYDIGVQDIATRLRLERTYFSALFKKRMGCSPIQYLKSYRLRHAAQLLERGNTPTVVAYSVGYEDIYLFSKMFKRHFGCSPREYARQHAKADAKRSNQ